jgi:hypothetical protein
MKVLASILVMLVWLTSIVILVVRVRAKMQSSNDSKNGAQTPKTLNKSAVEVVTHEKAITININANLLTNTIKLTMDTANNELKMHVLPGGIVEDPIPQPDVKEEDILSSGVEIDNAVLAQQAILQASRM